MFRLALLACFATANAYLWPNPALDQVDSLLYEILPGTTGIASFVQPCNTFSAFGGTNSGRSNAADWIRTAYHDMATHNITDGTGGMDASIRFAEEQARLENPGTGFGNTLSVLAGFSTRYVSIADILAIGTVIAVEECGGPQIPFRDGRVDATEPNFPGVPEPEQPLLPALPSC
ncbi:heme peroxidase [Mycena alexandri]|uniref:Peroxidase n=1 Tax=Mycena alexandri TaxID=1745969 RepID=A0AAD6TDK3_9AGAR|nr:heme peroxidase [Mycena alexandri]